MTEALSTKEAKKLFNGGKIQDENLQNGNSRLSHIVSKELKKNRKRQNVQQGRTGNSNESHNPTIAIIVFHVSDNRRRDMDGAASTILDCAVRAGVLDDDSLAKIPKESFCFVRCEPGQEKVELILIDKE